MGSSYVTQGAQPGTLWWPGWVEWGRGGQWGRRLKKEGIYMYNCDWLRYEGDHHNIVKQLSSNLKKEITSECQSTHYVIHKCWLAKKKKMPPELNNVLQDVIKILSHISVHALNSCLFSQLCEKMDAEHTRLLLYTEVRWLSKVDH